MMLWRIKRHIDKMKQHPVRKVGRRDIIDATVEVEDVLSEREHEHLVKLVELADEMLVCS